MRVIPSVRFGRFLIVGVSATLLQYAILIALVRASALHPILASTIGFIASAALNYTLNRGYTFRSRVAYFPGLLRFAMIAGLGLLVNAAVMATGAAAGLHYLAAQIAATAVVLMWSFHANQRWTFAGAGRTSEDRQ